MSTLESERVAVLVVVADGCALRLLQASAIMCRSVTGSKFKAFISFNFRRGCIESTLFPKRPPVSVQSFKLDRLYCNSTSNTKMSGTLII